MDRYIRHIFEKIYVANRHKIVFFAHSYLGSKEEAEGVAQEVFIILWGKMDELDLGKDILPYLITLTRNRCINILKSKKNTALNYTSVNIDRESIDCASLESADSNIIAAELNRILEQSLCNMSPDIRKTFLLNRNSNMKYSDIAKMEGVSVKTIEYRMMSALRIFRVNCKEFLKV